MAAHRYPIRKGKYEALSKKELARAVEIDNEEVSTDEEYKEYEKRMKDDRKLNDFLGEDDGNDTEFIPSKTFLHAYCDLAYAYSDLAHTYFDLYHAYFPHK